MKQTILISKSRMYNSILGTRKFVKGSFVILLILSTSCIVNINQLK